MKLVSFPLSHHNKKQKMFIQDKSYYVIGNISQILQLSSYSKMLWLIQAKILCQKIYIQLKLLRRYKNELDTVS